MNPFTVVNRFVIKQGKMQEFIETQRSFGASLTECPQGLLGGRMYRGLDGTTAILVSQFESQSAQQQILQSQALKEHIAKLQDLVESATPLIYEEAYTTGQFK
jgi:quinol monooxygenase YgiN